ncbi:MAG: ParA family protein [Desulfobacterales bacterium]|nr:ParA family protein [Desulfobacterales bacterium]
MTTLAIFSNKGGVGKTATAVNLSYLAARAGAKTLICDLDPQGSATYYFRVKPKLKSGPKGYVKGAKGVYKSVKGTDFENLDILPADFSLRKLDVLYNKFGNSKNRLKIMLYPFACEYKFIFLDCPVTIGILAENILNAADYILVPMIPTTLSVRTYRQLLAFARKKRYDTGKIYPFFSMVDRHKKMHRELMFSVSRGFKGVLQSFVPYRAHVEKMGIHRVPVPVFAPKSVAARSYQNLWDKIQNNVLSPH